MFTHNSNNNVVDIVSFFFSSLSCCCYSLMCALLQSNCTKGILIYEERKEMSAWLKGSVVFNFLRSTTKEFKYSKKTFYYNGCLNVYWLHCISCDHVSCSIYVALMHSARFLSIQNAMCHFKQLFNYTQPQQNVATT